MAFLHIDGDLYASARSVLTLCESRIVPGTVLVFDEFFTFETCDPAQWHNVWNHECRALMEWCQQHNRSVEMTARTNWMQATFRVVR